MDGETFTLAHEEFLIEYLPTQGYSSTSDNEISVGISTRLDEMLIQEGVVRDLIRQVQILRKDAGLLLKIAFRFLQIGHRI